MNFPLTHPADCAPPARASASRACKSASSPRPCAPTNPTPCGCHNRSPADASLKIEGTEHSTSNAQRPRFIIQHTARPTRPLIPAFSRGREKGLEGYRVVHCEEGRRAIRQQQWSQDLLRGGGGAAASWPFPLQILNNLKAMGGIHDHRGS